MWKHDAHAHSADYSYASGHGHGYGGWHVHSYLYCDADIDGRFYLNKHAHGRGNSIGQPGGWLLHTDPEHTTERHTVCSRPTFGYGQSTNPNRHIYCLLYRLHR